MKKKTKMITYWEIPQMSSIFLKYPQFSLVKFLKKMSKIEEVSSKSEGKCQKTIKANSKQFVCEYCNRAFSRNDNLKRHLNTKCSANNTNNIYKQLFFGDTEAANRRKKRIKKAN